MFLSLTHLCPAQVTTSYISQVCMVSVMIEKEYLPLHLKMHFDRFLTILICLQKALERTVGQERQVKALKVWKSEVYYRRRVRKLGYHYHLHIYEIQVTKLVSLMKMVYSKRKRTWYANSRLPMKLTGEPHVSTFQKTLGC